MQPALLPGDGLLARRRPPRIGEIVVFREPAGERFYVKRVAATGGASVEIEATTLTITGAGEKHTIALPHPEPHRSWLLLDDEIFVLSDDLTVTRADSRVFGPVDTTGIFTAVARYAPLRRMSLRLQRR